MASTLALPRVLVALRAVLVADATLTVLLAAAPSAYGGGPGIYSEGDVPAGAACDYLTIGAGTEVPANTMGDGAKWGSSLSVQIKAITTGGNLDRGYAILDRVAALLNGTTPAVSGYASSSAALELVADAYTELIAGVPYTHFPSIWRVTVHQS